MKNLILGAMMLSCAAFSLGQTKQTDVAGKDITCATCHRCDVPTKENPCVRECPRLTMVTVDHSPEEGPAVLVLYKSPEDGSLYGPVTFSHQWHAEMSELSGGCTMCHHYNPPGGILPCRECHSVSRTREQMGRPDLKAAYHRQCLDCHRRWSHSTECDGCHASRGELTTGPETTDPVPFALRKHPTVEVPKTLLYETEMEEGSVATFHHEEHVKLFGLECAECHTQEGCVHCHDTEKVGGPDVRPSGPGHEACEQCHETGDQCVRCHGMEAKPGFSHSRSAGWRLGRSHEGLECRRCHTRGGDFRGLDGSCQSCHGEWTSDTFDHRVTGIVLDETHREFECDVCHPDGQFRMRPTCDVCHDEIVYPDQLPGKRRTKR
jgi:hypothetical protein